MDEHGYLGIDFGTSGARAIAIDSNAQVLAIASFQYTQDVTEDGCNVWKNTLFALIAKIPETIRHKIRAIAINGTSSTVLICDESGQPLEQPLLYNDARGVNVINWVKAIAPADHTVVSATSSLAKLLWFIQKTTDLKMVGEGAKTPPPQIFNPIPNPQSLIPNPQPPTLNPQPPLPHFLHQADWLSFLLHGQLGITDYHNALKLGYDVEELRYPAWFDRVPNVFQLPKVVAPGEVIAPVLSEVSDRFGFPAECVVCAGTTDSIAALLASGVQAPGEAVTSLGSTLVLKLLSDTRIEDARYGIYSHRLGDLWLVGGASNTGGAVLRHFFSDTELAELSQQINLDRSPSFDYYPLLKPGERFPINDPNLLPRLEPRPDSAIDFLQELLTAMARIEARGYQLLQELGATSLTQVYTAGGGAKNEIWTSIRSQRLGVPVVRSSQAEAAYGSALLARRGVDPAN